MVKIYLIFITLAKLLHKLSGLREVDYLLSLLGDILWC